MERRIVVIHKRVRRVKTPVGTRDNVVVIVDVTIRPHDPRNVVVARDRRN